MKVGSLVECIKDFEWVKLLCPAVKDAEFPKVGERYLVRSIDDDGYIGVEEIAVTGVDVNGVYDIMFAVEYFRELQPPMDLTELLEETIEAPNLELCDATAVR